MNGIKKRACHSSWWIDKGNIIHDRKKLFIDENVENCDIFSYSQSHEVLPADAGYFRYKKTIRKLGRELTSEVIDKGVNVYFIRHGQSTSNRDGILAGGADYPLTSLGIVQTSMAAEKLASLGVNTRAIYSSPLSRSLDTAKIASRYLHVNASSIIVLNDLKGCGGGRLEGRPYANWYSVPNEDLVPV